MAAEFAGKMERGANDMEFRWNFSAYLRTSDRQLKNDFIGNNTWLEYADTYDHTRRIAQKGKYNAKGKATIRGNQSRKVIGIIKGGGG